MIRTAVTAQSRLLFIDDAAEGRVVVDVDGVVLREGLVGDLALGAVPVEGSAVLHHLATLAAQLKAVGGDRREELGLEPAFLVDILVDDHKSGDSDQRGCR